MADNAPIKLANKDDVEEEELEEEKDMSSPIWRVFFTNTIAIFSACSCFREKGKIYASYTRKT